MGEQSKQIISYQLGWNPNTKQGFALIAMQGSQPIRVKVESAQELAALGVVLRESPVFYRWDGLIHTGWEEVKE